MLQQGTWIHNHLALQPPQKTMCSHLLLTESKGRGASGGDTGKEYLSGSQNRKTADQHLKDHTPSAEDTSTFVSGECGTRAVGMCRWAVKVTSIVVLGSLMGVFSAQDSPHCLSGWFLSPSQGGLSVGPVA